MAAMTNEHTAPKGPDNHPGPRIAMNIQSLRDFQTPMTNRDLPNPKAWGRGFEYNKLVHKQYLCVLMRLAVVKFSVIPTRFERVTVCLEGRCSIQLSYGIGRFKTQN